MQEKDCMPIIIIMQEKDCKPIIIIMQEKDCKPIIIIMQEKDCKPIIIIMQDSFLVCQNLAFPEPIMMLSYAQKSWWAKKYKYRVWTLALTIFV